MALKLFKRGQTVLLMLPDGGMRIYADAVRVARVMKDYPGFMVGSHNSARLHLPPEKLLRPGNSYFLHAPSETDPGTAVPPPRLDTTGGLAEYTRDYGDYDKSSPDQWSPASDASWTAKELRRASISLHSSTAARPSLPSRANSAPRYSLDVRNDGRGGIHVAPTPAVPPRLLCAGDVRVALGASMGKSMSFPDFAGLESGDVALRAQSGSRVARGNSGGGSGDWGSGENSPGAIWECEEEEGRMERSNSGGGGGGLTRRRSGIPSSRYAAPEPQLPPLQPQQQQQQQQQRAWKAGQYGQLTPPTGSGPLPPISTHALNMSPASPCQHSPSVFSPLARSAYHHSHFQHVQLQQGL
ncbi:unnamed protein product [Closterium sp. NIES-64]|nr:unnamed protein product [Closterium sp. NIES-64]